MFKNLYYVMNYPTFFKWQMTAVVVGAVYGWWAKKQWDSYKEACDAERASN